jgi:hypothetical protein
MRTETARLYKEMLSLQGHPVDLDTRIGDELTGATPASLRRTDPRADTRAPDRLERRSSWFDSFLLLGGHDPIDPHQPNDAIASPERIGVGHC